MLLLELTPEEQQYEVYIKAALELMASDSTAKPQVRELVKMVGGSSTTAKNGMHAFWSYLERLLDYRSAYPEKVAPEVITLCEKLLVRCRIQAKSDFDQERDALVAASKQCKEDLEQLQQTHQTQLAEQQERISHLQQQNAQLTQQYDSAVSEQAQMRSLLEQSNQKLASIEAANIELNKHIARLEQGAENQQNRIDALNSTIQTEMAKRAALSSELEIAKQQQLMDKDAIHGLEHRLDISQHNLGSLEANYAQKTQQYEELKTQKNQQLAQCEADNQALHQQKQALETELSAVTEKWHTAQIAAAKAQVLEQQLNALTATLNRNQNEKGV